MAKAALDAFEEITDRRATITVDPISSEARGPYLELLSTAFRALGIGASAEHYANRAIREARSESASVKEEAAGSLRIASFGHTMTGAAYVEHSNSLCGRQCATPKKPRPGSPPRPMGRTPARGRRGMPGGPWNSSGFPTGQPSRELTRRFWKKNGQHLPQGKIVSTQWPCYARRTGERGIVRGPLPFPLRCRDRRSRHETGPRLAPSEEKHFALNIRGTSRAEAGAEPPDSPQPTVSRPNNNRTTSTEVQSPRNRQMLDIDYSPFLTTGAHAPSATDFQPSLQQSRAIAEIKDWFCHRRREQQAFRLFGAEPAPARRRSPATPLPSSDSTL